MSVILDVDRSTVRRDLERLEARGLARRTRGGALPGPSSGFADIPYEVKRIEHTPEKQAIGRAAASRVREGGGGSARFRLDDLPDRSGTSRLPGHLCGHQRSQCRHVSCGLTRGAALRHRWVLLESVYTLVGPGAVQELRDLHVDRTFLGADAIHHRAGITNVTVVEVEMKQAMIGAATEVVVVADSSKFEHHALAKVCGLDAVDVIVTDEGLDPSVRALYGDCVQTVPLAGR